MLSGDAGAADVAALRSTILQVTVPDRLRGRLSGIFSLVVTGGPKLGDVEGLVANYSPRDQRGDRRGGVHPARSSRRSPI
jgi:hypothetical protein